MRKSGGGAHNWGNIEDQIEGEMYDDGEEETVNDARKAASDASSSPVQANDRRLSVSTASTGTSSNLTEEKEKAVEYRAKALRGGDRESSIDLSWLSISFNSVCPGFAFELMTLQPLRSRPCRHRPHLWRHRHFPSQVEATSRELWACSMKSERLVCSQKYVLLCLSVARLQIKGRP